MRLARLALLASILAAPAAARPADRAEDIRIITAGERAWGEAYVTGDVAAVQRLLADDFAGINPRGVRFDKAKVLKDVGEGPPSTSDRLGPVEIRFYGDTAVAQAHEYEVGPAPKRTAVEHVFTDTWVKLGGRWRIVASEDVEVQPPMPGSN